MLTWAVVLMGWSALVAQSPASHPAVRADRELSAERIEQLISQLSHPRYSAREEATKALCQLDETDLPLLLQHYRSESRFEPKRRIRYLIEYVFHRDQIVGRNGFMGIEVFQQTLPDLSDPVSRNATRGVVIKKVKPGFAAERAGLKDYDVVIALNGQPVPEDPGTDSFVLKVGSNPPGTMLSLRILRPTDSRAVALTAGPEPLKMLDGARLAVIGQDITPQGIWVTGVEPKSPAAAMGLKPNEIIRSLNGMALGTYGNNQIEGILRSMKEGSEAKFELVGSQALNIDVKLGSRPPEFIMNPKDQAEARARFMRWWQEQGGDLPARLPDASGIRVVFGGAPPPPRVAPETSLLP